MTPGLVLGYDAWTEALEADMGGKVKDYGIGHDHGLEGRGIRLHVSQGAPAFHLPSPRLSRQDVRNLRRMSRGRAAVPDRLEGWWLALAPLDQEGVEELLRGLSWLSWLAFWWAAGDGEDVQPDQPGRAEEHRAGV